MEALLYPIPFWLFIFSSDFRRKVLEVWRSRTGLQHFRTAFEATGATLMGLVILLGPFAMIAFLIW